jgi:hypothetical protein
MLVFSITLTPKRVRQSVSIILVLDTELASVRALLVKDLDHSNLPSTLELVCDVPCLLQYSCTHTHKQNSENANIGFHEHIYTAHTVTHTRTHTHKQTPAHKDMHTKPSES